MKKRKYKSVKGFNMNKKTGHTSYAYKQHGEWVSSLGFTHDKKEDHGKKTKLKYNINPNDSRDCYVKNKVEIFKSKFYKTKPDYVYYRIHITDKPLIDEIIRKNSNKKRRF